MRSIPVPAARSLAPDRSLALPLSSTAHPCAPARPSASAFCCTLARPPVRRHGGGTLGAQMFLAIPSWYSSPLLSVFRDPRRTEPPGRPPARSPLSLFHRESRRGRRSGRCTYSVNTSPSLARMDGRRNSSLTVAPFNCSLSLTLGPRDRREDGRKARRLGLIREASYVSGARPASV